MKKSLILSCGLLVLGLGALEAMADQAGDEVVSRAAGGIAFTGGFIRAGDAEVSVALHRRVPGRGGGGGVVLEHRRERIRAAVRPESYTILKGGGLRVGEDPAAEGVFLGFEVGGVLEDVLEIGFNTDYFYHRSETVRFTSVSRFESLPVELVAFDRTSVHLLPLGLTLRLVLPFAGDFLRPFVSGTASYEMLFLENSAAFDPNDPVLGWLAQDETFTGFGWQGSVGARMRLSPSVGLFGEVGYHDSSPSQRYLVDGIPVDLRVDLSGPFLRGGLRFRL